MTDNTLTGGTYGRLYMDTTGSCTKRFEPRNDDDYMKERSEIDHLRMKNASLEEIATEWEKRCYEYEEIIHKLTGKCMKYKETLKAVVDLMNE